MLFCKSTQPPTDNGGLEELAVEVIMTVDPLFTKRFPAEKMRVI